MKARLAILIFIGLLVITAAIISICIYKRSIQNQYDEYIIKYSQMENEPALKPVDAAIVKAIISARTNFTARFVGENDEMGLCLIPKDGLEKFLDFHNTDDFIAVSADNKKEYGLACPNRIFPNHKNQPAVSPRGTRAFCPVCNSRMVQELFDPEINIRIGTWYLAFLNAYIKENIDGLSDEDASTYSILVFGTGLETILANIETQLRTTMKEKTGESTQDLPPEVVIRYLKQYLDAALENKQLLDNIQSIKKRAEKYRPGLKKKAESMGIELAPGNSGNTSK